MISEGIVNYNEPAQVHFSDRNMKKKVYRRYRSWICSVKLEVNIQVMEPLVHITSAYVMQSLLETRLVAHLLLLNWTAKIEVLKFRSFFVAPVLVLNRQRRRGDNAGCKRKFELTVNR